VELHLFQQFQVQEVAVAEPPLAVVEVLAHVAAEAAEPLDQVERGLFTTTVARLVRNGLAAEAAASVDQAQTALV
jgi:hypothetical protein